jgi:hypothetical protein
MAKVRLRDLNPAKFLNDLEVDGNALVGGDVGIGTGSVAPSTLLEIKSTSQAKLLINRDAANDAELEFKNTEQSWTIGIDRSNSNAYTISTSTSLGNTGVRVHTDGKVGIGTGTTTPTEMLTINSASNTRILLQEGGSDKGKIAVGGSGLYIQAAAGRINFRNTSDADTVLIEDTGYVGMIAAAQIRLTLGSQGTAGTNDANWIRGNGTQLEYNSASSNHNWEVGGSAKMRLDSTGRLGVGSVNPVMSLDLGSGTSNRGIAWGGTSGTAHYATIWTEYSSADLILGSFVKPTGDSTGMKASYSTSGNAMAAIKFDASAGDILFYGEPPQALVKDVTQLDTIRMKVSADGNVGIGTGSGAVGAKLHIEESSDGALVTPLKLINPNQSVGSAVAIDFKLSADSITAAVQLKAISPTAGVDGELVISTRKSGVGLVERVRVSTNGNVGIAVDPSGIPASYAGGLNVNSKVLINANLVLRYGLSNGNNADFYHNGQTLTIRNTGTGSGVGDGHILLKTNRNVGIGSFSGSGPTYNLHVEGSLYANTISVGTGFSDLVNAGQLTARKSSSGNTADADAALVVEDSTNAILEFLTQAGNGGTINFSSNKKGVCQIKAELPNKLHFYAGEAHQLTLNQSGSNNVNFSKLGAGTVQSDASGNLSVSSSAALKTDVIDYSNGLSNVINLRPVKFRWKEETGLDYNNDYVGFIAEEVEEELPDAVLCPEETCTPDGEMVPNGKSKGLSDRVIIAALVNSVKELNTRIEQLENN